MYDQPVEMASPIIEGALRHHPSDGTRELGPVPSNSWMGETLPGEPPCTNKN